MKIVFASNFYNHHQSVLSEELFRLTEGQYIFISTSEMPEEQRRLGYGHEAVPDYVWYSYISEDAYNQCLRAINDADVVITGSAPERMFRERIKAGKLIFRYSERPLKRGLQPIKYLPRLLRWHWRSPMHKPIYMLCASAYTAADYAKFGLFRNRCYKWGYFPQTIHYDVDKLMELKKAEVASILWCGRFLALKHPDDVIEVAERLKSEGYRFQLNFIGTGPMEQQLGEMIRQKGLSDCISLLGSMSPEDVRRHMEQANIYLFTSDRQEGWGAVLNESMNSGCAVVACSAIGSVPFLLKDGVNGFTYASGDLDQLYEKVKFLLDNSQKGEEMGIRAYQTMSEMWNAKVAAERLLQLSNALLNKETKPVLFTDGPCSKAEILGDDGH